MVEGGGGHNDLFTVIHYFPANNLDPRVRFAVLLRRIIEVVI